jgi:nucleoside phosphorylase
VLEAIFAAHRPRLVMAGGLCCGLLAPAQKDAVIVASEAIDEGGRRIVLGGSGWRPSETISGPLLSLDRAIRSVSEKRALAADYGAIAVDRDTFCLAEACAADGVPFLSLCIVADGPDDEAPRDIRYLLERKTAASKAGALAGTLLRRPSHLKHLWQIKETALEAGEKLAQWVVRLAQDLPQESE